MGAVSEMAKATSLLVASALTAASTLALPSSHLHTLPPFPQEKGGKKAPGKDNFAPRMDGLRFIETLVTAHR